MIRGFCVNRVNAGRADKMTTSLPLKNTHSEGSLAFNNGEPITACPESLTYNMKLAWRCGWYDARETRKNSQTVMKSLGQHNAERTRLHNSGPSVLNGIECPSCGNELKDSAPLMTLLSIPPQKRIHCDKCEYVGTRIS